MSKKTETRQDQPAPNKAAGSGRLRRLVSHLVYVACCGALLGSAYIVADLISPEHWIPTIQWMHDWAQLFTLPTFVMLGIGGSRMTRWFDGVGGRVNN